MKKIDLGPYGRAVARNVRRLRGDMSYAELSRLLTAGGRPIPPLGLRHLEAGSRQVNVDELVALAIALDTTPIALLLPTGATQIEETLLLLIGGRKGIDLILTRRTITDGDNQ